jgi:dTDP-4-amino-4,6-dideoxygalactose transaminase
VTDTSGFIPFALPSIGKEEIEAVTATLESGWLTTGPRCSDFEADFRTYLGTESTAIAVSSATAGLHLALESVGVGPGDKVIVPTYTFTATAEVVRYLGATPVLADVDVDSLNLDAADVERLLAKHPETKAVMPVHVAGLACDMSAIRDVATSNGVAVIEDAAHALPTISNGELVGARSEYAVFSFYATKGITTGEGGMVVVADNERADRVRTMSFHGVSRLAYDRYQSKKPAWHYDVVAPGYKYNMSDIAASIGIQQLRKADQFLTRRTAIASRYLEAFSDLPLKLPSTGGEGDVHSWHLFIIRLDTESLEIDRDAFITQMSEAGVGASVHFIPLHLHPYWADFTGLVPSDLPVAVDAYERAVSLPIYPAMTDHQVERVVDVVTDILHKHTR